MARTPVEFAIAGDLKIGAFPHIPIRWALQSALTDALGITEDDSAELGALREAGKDVPEDWTPSGERDGFGVLFVKAAALGLCWPTALDCPTLRACRHDPVLYGEGVYDALIRVYASVGKVGQLQKDVQIVGSKLIADMNTEAGEVFGSDVATEKDFSEGPGLKSIGG